MPKHKSDPVSCFVAAKTSALHFSTLNKIPVLQIQFRFKSSESEIQFCFVCLFSVAFMI